MANIHSQISMTLTMKRILFVLINLIVLNCVAIKCASDFSRNFGLSRRSTDSILDTGQLVRYIFIASFIWQVVLKFIRWTPMPAFQNTIGVLSSFLAAIINMQHSK